MVLRKRRYGVVSQITEMEHFLRDGRRVSEEMNSCGRSASAKCRYQNFCFLGDDDKGGGGDGTVEDPLNRTL